MHSYHFFSLQPNKKKKKKEKLTKQIRYLLFIITHSIMNALKNKNNLI